MSSRINSKLLLENSDNSQAVFIIKESLLNFSKTSCNIEVKCLRHPGTSESGYFAISSNQIFEIIEFQQSNRSWLINESFSSNGRLYLTLPTDPLFFAIFYLRKYCLNQARPLNQLEDNDFPCMFDLVLNKISSEKLNNIADEKCSFDVRAYRYNHDKVLNWLQLKVKYLAYVLTKKKMYAGSGAISNNYIKSEELFEYQENDYLKLACEIISTYLTTDLHHELENFLGIVRDQNLPKRKSIGTDMKHTNKKIKLDESNSIKSIQKEKKQSNKEKSLAKAASGSKSISSFFKKS